MHDSSQPIALAEQPNAATTFTAKAYAAKGATSPLAPGVPANSRPARHGVESERL